MRAFIRIVAGIIIGESALAVLIGLVGIFGETGSQQTQAATLFGSWLAGILFSGVAWIVVDIANAGAPERTVTLPKKSNVTPDYTDIINPDAIPQGIERNL